MRNSQNSYILKRIDVDSYKSLKGWKISTTRTKNGSCLGRIDIEMHVALTLHIIKSSVSLNFARYDTISYRNP